MRIGRQNGIKRMRMRAANLMVINVEGAPACYGNRTNGFLKREAV
jgi:hypothetical protein